MRIWILSTVLCAAHCTTIQDVRNEVCEVGFKQYLPPFVRRMVPCPFETSITEQSFTKNQIRDVLAHDLPVLNSWIREHSPDLHQCIS